MKIKSGLNSFEVELKLSDQEYPLIIFSIFQSNGHDTNTKSQINASNDHNKENSAVLQDLLMKKEAEMKMETNGQDQDDEITKGVLAKLSSEILVTPKAEAKIDMKFLPKVTPNGEKLNIFNHTSNLNMTMSSVILNGENF